MTRDVRFLCPETTHLRMRQVSAALNTVLIIGVLSFGRDSEYFREHQRGLCRFMLDSVIPVRG